MPPIDPLQLLKALSPLLAANGGVKSNDEVIRLSSLMRKFSRKLVSRCVYINVLRATDVGILEVFLKEGGWETINMWLSESKGNPNYPFLIELLRLFKTLPMTVERLKENNNAKLIKAYAKCDNNEVRILATEVVGTWMKLIKGETSTNGPVETKETKDSKLVKKKKRKDSKDEGKKEHVAEHERRDSKDLLEKKTENRKAEMSKKGDKVEAKVEKATKENAPLDLEDVKLPDYVTAEPLLRKPKRDRPKTVKTFQTKFRSTGLEEAIPLPKPVTKKNNFSDKTAALAAKNAVKRIGISVSKDSMPLEKKAKPSTIISTSSEASDKPGIKLIPPKPKPVHIIKESAGFMDALVGDPISAPTKKKRKSSKTSATPTSPSPISPTTVTPKLQFYKDTLESDSEKTEKDGDKENDSDNGDGPSSPGQEGDNDTSVKEMDVDESSDDKSSKSEKSEAKSSNGKNGDEKNKKKESKNKKKVSWAEEPNLRQTYYFELDETERVNVNNIKNFGDMKTLERMKERQAVETARRMMSGDKMEEKAQWVTPFAIEMASVVEPGCNSTQKEIQHIREQGILQEIYFSKDSIPDSPYEPDAEFVEPQEPKIIPLDDENNPDSLVDYSMMEPPAPITALPPALSNLMMSLNHKQNLSPNPSQMMGDTDHRFGDEMPQEPFFPPGGPPNMMPPDMYGSGPPPPPPFFDGYGPPHEVMDGPPPPMRMPPPDGEFGDFYENMPPPPMMGPPPPMGPRMRHPGPMRGRNMGPPRGRIMHPFMMRGRGGPPRVKLCRHFMAGTCKYSESCIFLHPGINGPMIPPPP